jgi:hypothetical protein
MDFVPEGEYVLKVSSGADSYFETGDLPAPSQGTYTRLRRTHLYADAVQKIDVLGDLSGVVIPLNDTDIEKMSSR